MLKQSELLRKEISGKHLYNTVKEVSSYHRIQASTGFREAANYCKNKLDKLGIEARIIEYKADANIWCMQNRMFLEWDLKRAWMRLEKENLLLADTDIDCISIIQKSYPYDFRDGCDLVYLEKGNQVEEYKDVDLKGKIIFVREPFKDFVNWAIKDKGALGIVTDYMRLVPGIRTRENLYDSLNYTSFWWEHTEDEPKCFGFVLSPRMGDTLASLCLKQKEAYEKKEEDSPYLRVVGNVDTSLYPGKMEVVEAKLPGESKEEVTICAHLCHPKSSCNDNASGVAAAIESLRALKTLMDSGKLPRNKRTIKIVLMPELHGTAAYFTNKEHYENMVGAINMDMVGGKQTRFYGPITLTSLPYSTPSFINDLTALCMDYAAREKEGLSEGKIAITNHKVDMYTGGSDHIAYCDPTIGVPCCMIGQWPDLNYHTATDTLDVIDPEVLSFSTHISSLFAYTLANLDKEDVKEIQSKAHVSLIQRLSGLERQYTNKEITKEQFNKSLVFVEEFYINCVKDYKRVLSLEESVIEKEIKWIQTTVGNMRTYTDVEYTEWIKEDTRVFVRDYAGYIDTLEHTVNAHEGGKPYYEAYMKVKVGGIKGHGMEALIPFYINGKNSVSDIVDRLECDMQCDCKENVVSFIALLEAMKMIHEI